MYQLIFGGNCRSFVIISTRIPQYNVATCINNPMFNLDSWRETVGICMFDFGSSENVLCEVAWESGAILGFEIYSGELMESLGATPPPGIDIIGL